MAIKNDDKLQFTIMAAVRLKTDMIFSSMPTKTQANKNANKNGLTSLIFAFAKTKQTKNNAAYPDKDKMFNFLLTDFSIQPA